VACAASRSNPILFDGAEQLEASLIRRSGFSLQRMALTLVCSNRFGRKVNLYQSNPRLISKPTIFIRLFIDKQ
jgi:hypothetical protein